MNKDRLTEHEKILKRYTLAKNAWSTIFSDYVSDLKFASGDQWDEKVKKERESNNLTALSYNQLPSKINFIVNNARSATPNIKINPVSGEANKNTAKILDGIVKYIQYKYNAKDAYINALDNAVTGGVGAWRINVISSNENLYANTTATKEMEEADEIEPVDIAEPIAPDDNDDDEFDIEIERILDVTSVLFDPNAKKMNFKDAEYVFVTNWIPKDEFEENYPDAECEGVGDTGKGMFNKDAVAVLEYWCKNKKTGYVEQYLVTGSEILSHNKHYRGKNLPIVMLTGHELHIEGERKYKGIVRDVKDIQILLNLSKSRTADYIAQASNQQTMVTPEQIAGYEDIWLNGNVNGLAVLPYNQTELGKPQREQPPAPPAGFMQVSSEADADMRSAIGIRDPMADIPAGNSGKAIQLQISQGNLGTFEFHDHLKSAIKFTGEIIVDLIPWVFKYPHIREIMGLDGQVNTVELNKPYIENGQAVLHDLTKGKYAVTISDGPSYESQRDEASDKLLEIIKAHPEFMQTAGDIVFRNMTFNGADEIADRIKATIPPNILAASNATNGDSESQAQMLISQLNQMGQQMQQMQQALEQSQQVIQQLNQEKQCKIVEIQTKAQADAQLRVLDHEHEMEMAKMKLNGASNQIAEKGIVDIEKMNEEFMLERRLGGNVINQ